jgi:hypothetical protein
VAHLVAAAETLVREGQHEEAATLLRTALQLDPFRAEARSLLGKVRDAQIRELYSLLPRDHVPVPARKLESSSPRERRVFDRLNGRWDVAAVAMTSGLGELEALRALRRLVHAGVVRLRPPR